MRAVLVVAFLVLAGVCAAQQPPAINPAAARLEQTLAGLDGAGVGLAASDAVGLFAACDDRALHYWTPDLLLGVRTSEAGNFALRGHGGPIVGVAAGGKVVASAGADGKILVWAPPADKARLVLDAKGPVRAVAVSADGKTVAAAGEDGSAHLWDAEKGQPGTKIPASSDWLLTVAFSPDGKLLATGGHDGKWRLFELPGGKKLVEGDAAPPPMKKEDPREVAVVTAVAFAPDGKSLAVAAGNGQVYQYQADGKFVRALAGHTAGVADVAFHPSGKLLASAGKDRTVRLWNPADGAAVKTLEGHAAWVAGVAFYGQGTRLASVSADRTVKLWDLTEPKK